MFYLVCLIADVTSLLISSFDFYLRLARVTTLLLQVAGQTSSRNQVSQLVSSAESLE